MTWGQTDTTALSSLSTNGFSNPSLKILNPYSPATPRQTVSARLYASCATAQGSAQLGVYDVTDGHAGAPRVTAASVNIPVMAEGWISFALPTVTLAQGRTYHAAIVGNRNGDSRLYRKTTTNSALQGGSGLPTNWSGPNLSNLDWLFEVITSPVMSIDTINSDSSNPDIDVTASNTATTTGLGTITATTFTDGNGFVSTATPTMPSGDGSFVFAWPWADGSQQAKFGSVTASMSDGTLTATLPANLALPATYSSTTWSGATDLGEFYLGHYLTLTNDNRVYYPTVVDGITVTINPDGWMSFSSLPVTVPLLLHDCRSGGSGVITTKTLIVTESGAVVVDGGGLTTRGLTVSAPTVRGLTVTGL